MPKGKYIIEFSLAPGDVIVSTALIRDLKRTYPDYQFDFRTNVSSMLIGNPHLTPLQDNDPDVEVVKLCYMEQMRKATTGDSLHFIEAFHRDFTAKTGLPVEALEAKPDLHMTIRERLEPPVSGRYWVVMGGGKADFTVKHWEYTRYNEVVDRLHAYGLRFVQTGATKKGHTHPRIDQALPLVGWGYMRELVNLIYHSEGVICPLTCGMHIAAAFDKPCVVIAGGRESASWTAYCNGFDNFPKAPPVKVEHQFLHTVGRLSCCERSGCWRNKVVQTDEDKNVCTKLATRPIGYQPLPLCMDMITVDHVVEAVLSYYEKGLLAPL